MFNQILKVYGWRDSILTLGLSDVKSRYVGSVLGFTWSLLEPLLIILIYSLIFPTLLMVDFVDWVLFFITGLIPYRYLRSGITEITSSLIQYREVLTKVDIPPEVIPLAKALSNSISFLLESLIIVCLVFPFARPTWYILLYPILFLTQLFVSLGVGLWFCCSFPHLRDLTYILRVVFEALLFLTPIVYKIDRIPEAYREVYLLNPLARLIYLWQAIMLRSVQTFIEYIPILENVIGLFCLSLLILAVGWWRFDQLKSRVMGEL
jgi:ABC-2 type transport system permease protein